MIDETKKKIKNLPPEVFYILTAEKAADLGVMITDRYDLNGDQVALMTDLIEKIYVKDLRLADLYTQIKSSFGFDDAKTRLLTCDIAGFRLLPVSDWLGEDVANFIRSLGGNADGYLFENEELKRLAAADLATDTLIWQEPVELPALVDDQEIVATDDQDDDDDDDVEVELTPEESIEQYKQMIANNLYDLLLISDHLFIQQFNYRLIGLLVDHIELKNDLIVILMNNQLKIGTETIVLDGRQLQPTIENWIRFFISQKGSELFDAVTLSDFLINSTSAKFLSVNDKELLSRLLQLYRNIKFFPDSLVGDNPDAWEILTYVGDQDYKFITVKNSQVAMVETTQPEASIKKEVKAELTVDPLKLESLRRLSDKYPDGSLERLAVEEEIKRLTGV